MLEDVAAQFSNSKIVGNKRISILGVSQDSRAVSKGDLFIALQGKKADGQNYIAEALKRGASAIAIENELTPQGAPTLLLPNLRERVGSIASLVYGKPTSKMKVIGVTGTNGKTTTASLISDLLERLGEKTGYIGTLSYRWPGVHREARHTTPEASDLQKLFYEMAESHVSHVALECSSHGLALHRLKGTEFDVAVFTNLTQDHLDFHPNMDAYEAAKWSLFAKELQESPKRKRTAVLNIDDPVGRKWAGEVATSLLTYSLHDDKADVFADQIQFQVNGFKSKVRFNGQEKMLASSLAGMHNVSNLLAVISAGLACEKPFGDLVESAGELKSVAGRLERIENGRGVQAFVDYAHTDDALTNVLQTLEKIKKRRMIVVFGCGGDRDRAKRPKMARAVSVIADAILITSDNPRTENPEKILDEIEQGILSNVKKIDPGQFDKNTRKAYAKITDRASAIEIAARMASEGDIILVAGKGHETYQEIAGERLPFDDREKLRDALRREG